MTLGFPPKNIICMQGPFSRELNVALLRQYHIQTLVTKDTGGYGGFREKAEAAREAGCALLVVERQNHGPFYVNYNNASNSNSNIGCRLLEADAGRRTCRVWLNLLLVVRVPHPFYYASLTAQHLLKMSRQDTA